MTIVRWPQAHSVAGVMLAVWFLPRQFPCVKDDVT
jgi:hypothetical protein